MRKTLLLAFSLAGLFISIYLWWVYTSPTHALVCIGTGCDAVRASQYANLWGFPLPVYGVAMYSALVLLIFAEQLISSNLAGRVRDTFTAVVAAGFIFSAYLTYLEGFVIHAWCAWCLGSAISITIIFLLTILLWVRPPRRPEDTAALATLRRHFSIVIVAILLGIPAFVILSRSGETPPVVQASTDAIQKYLIRPDSHMTGNLDAPLTVVEFGDFECPVCGTEEPIVQEILKKYGNRIRFIFRQYPIFQIHRDAMHAAEASECAAIQGKFWEAAHKLYDSQNDLTDPALNLYAVELGLDKDRFSQCLSSDATLPKVRQDMDDAHQLGVDRTPTFFIGQQKVAKPLTLEEFSNLLDRELAAGTSGKGPAPASTTASGTASGASGSAFGEAGGNIFASSQGSEIACSNDEAKKAQPDLIRTDDTRKLFEGASKPLFVDVRSVEDFAAGHLPGAVNVPVDEFEHRWNSLPKDRIIVLYESGKSSGDICASSRAAGRILLEHGFPREQVKVYQDGLGAWQKAGLPTNR